MGENRRGVPILGYIRTSSFCLFTALALALSIAFVVSPLGRIKLEDIRDADPKYGTFLVDVIFPSSAPEFIRLQTLGEYKSFTKVPGDEQIFGLTKVQTNTIKPVLELIFKGPVVKKYMQIPSFVGLNGKTVVTNEIAMASPLWVFRHNLQLLDVNLCGNTSLQLAMQHSSTIDTGTGEIVVWDGAGRACVPSTPTAVNYRRCYDNLDRHRQMVGVQVGVWVILLLIHIVALAILRCRSAENTRFYIDLTDWTDTLQGGALIAVLSLEIFEWSHGIAATVPSSEVTACPDKQTGLSGIYQCLLAAHIFKWVSLFLLLMRHSICK